MASWSSLRQCLKSVLEPSVGRCQYAGFQYTTGPGSGSKYFVEDAKSTASVVGILW